MPCSGDTALVAAGVAVLLSRPACGKLQSGPFRLSSAWIPPPLISDTRTEKKGEGRAHNGGFTL